MWLQGSSDWIVAPTVQIVDIESKTIQRKRNKKRKSFILIYGLQANQHGEKKNLLLHLHVPSHSQFQLGVTISLKFSEGLDLTPAPGNKVTISRHYSSKLHLIKAISKNKSKVRIN